MTALHEPPLRFDSYSCAEGGAGGRMQRERAFVEFLIGRGLSARTIELYTVTLRRATKWFTAHGYDLAAPTPTQVAEYAAAGPNSHATRSQLRSTLRWYWESIGVTGPMRAVRVPPQPDMVCKAIEDAEARAVVKVSLGWWPQGTATLLGMYLALRREEIASAEWARFKGDWYVVTGKGDRTATLPVHPVLMRELDGAPRRSRYLFSGSRGRAHVTPTTVWLWVLAVCEEAGVGRVTPHMLRHTSLAMANDRTGDLRAVQTFARHRKPETTAGYTRTTRRKLRGISDSLDYLDD